MSEAPPSMPPAVPEQAAPQSLPARLLNVIAAPGEVFDSIKNRPPMHSNWLVPALLLLLVSWIGAGLVFSNESIRQQVREISEKAIEKQIAKQHMSEAQAEKVREAAAKFGGISQIVGGALVPVFMAFVTPFFVGLLLWLGASFVFKAPIPYMKAVEVVGLASMISVLEAIVRTLLILVTGNMFASLSPMLLIKEFNPQSTLHSLALLVNPLVFWLLSVRAIGLARVTGRSFMKAAIWVFGLWCAYTGFMWALGRLGQMMGERMGGG